jgi:hypothetical protein
MRDRRALHVHWTQSLEPGGTWVVLLMTHLPNCRIAIAAHRLRLPVRRRARFSRNASAE